MIGPFSSLPRRETKSLLSILAGTDICIDTTRQAQAIINRAAANRILYTLARAVTDSQVSGGTYLDQPLQRIAALGDNLIDKQRQTLTLLTETLGDHSIPVLLIKTSRALPYISDDIDIIVPGDQYTRTIDVLIRNGAKADYAASSGQQAHLVFNGLQTVDVHRSMRWWNAPALSDELVWARPIHASYLGVPCVFPNQEVELAARTLDSGWQRQALGILDVLDIKMLGASANVDRVREEASRFGWSDLLDWISRWAAELAVMLGDPTVTAQGRLHMTSERTECALPTAMPVVFPWTRTLRIMAEHVASGNTPVFREYLYLAYARARFHLTSGRRIAMLGRWHSDVT